VAVPLFAFFGTLIHAVRRYRVALGREPVGHKVREGDGRTPEGRYTIDRRNPRSAYHLRCHDSWCST